MADATLAVALLARTFLKLTAKMAEDLPFGGGAISALVDSSEPAISSWLAQRLDLLGIGITSRRRLIDFFSDYDLLGLAWSEELASRDANELLLAFGPQRKDVWKRLSPDWMIAVITQSQVSSDLLERGITLEKPSDYEVAVEVLRHHLLPEISNELSIASDAHTETFVASVLSSIPDRINALLEVIPGRREIAVQALVERIDRQTDAVLDQVSGAAQKRSVLRKAHEIAQAYLDRENSDMFGRSNCSDEDPPLLPLSICYVEPNVRASETSSEVTPAIATIMECWRSAPLVVLHAPFGYGKSLTCRILSQRLAAAFLSKSSESIPILINCPSILKGHVSTLAAAIEQYLQREMKLTAAEANILWEQMPCTLILDSFDEVQQDDASTRSWFEEIDRNAVEGQRRILLATRPHAYSDRWRSTKSSALGIEPFSIEQVGAFLDTAGPLLNPNPPDYVDVARRFDAETIGIPILLLMALWSWDEDGPLLEGGDAGRTALYESFFARVSRGKWEGVQSCHPVIAEAANIISEAEQRSTYERALRLVAWESLCLDDADEGLPRRKIEDALSREFFRLSEERIHQVLRSMVLSLFFQRTANADAVVFSHRSFREYLCACYVRDALMMEHADPTTFAASACLAQAQLRREEYRFLSVLLRKTDKSSHILALLDRLSADSRFLFFQNADVASFTAHPKLVFSRGLGADCSHILRDNAESIALHIRGADQALLECFETNYWPAAELDTPYRVLRPDEGFDVGYFREAGAHPIIILSAELTAMTKDALVDPEAARLSLPWRQVGERLVFSIGDCVFVGNGGVDFILETGYTRSRRRQDIDHLRQLRHYDILPRIADLLEELGTRGFAALMVGSVMFAVTSAADVRAVVPARMEDSADHCRRSCVTLVRTWTSSALRAASSPFLLSRHASSVSAIAGSFQEALNCRSDDNTYATCRRIIAEVRNEVGGLVDSWNRIRHPAVDDLPSGSRPDE